MTDQEKAEEYDRIREFVADTINTRNMKYQPHSAITEMYEAWGFRKIIKRFVPLSSAGATMPTLEEQQQDKAEDYDRIRAFVADTINTRNVKYGPPDALTEPLEAWAFRQIIKRFFPDID